MTEQTTIEIIKIVIGALSGGAVGAIITAIVNNRKNKIQRIEKQVEVINIFNSNELTSPYITKITISGTTESFHYDNLCLVKVEIKNISNKDFKNFSFGISTPDSAHIISAQVQGKDRHHKITYSPEINFSNSSGIVDFTLEPLNRKDFYKMTLFITTNKEVLKENEISFSSSESVIFVDSEILKKTALEVFRNSITPTLTVSFR